MREESPIIQHYNNYMYHNQYTVLVVVLHCPLSSITLHILVTKPLNDFTNTLRSYNTDYIE